MNHIKKIIMVLYVLYSSGVCADDAGERFLNHPTYALKKGYATIKQTKAWVKAYLRIQDEVYGKKHVKLPLKLEYKGCDEGHRWLFIEDPSLSGNSNHMYLVFSESQILLNQKRYKYLGQDGFIFNRLLCYKKANPMKMYLIKGWHMSYKDTVYQLEELTPQALIHKGKSIEIDQVREPLLSDKIRVSAMTEAELLSLFK